MCAHILIILVQASTSTCWFSGSVHFYNWHWLIDDHLYSAILRSLEQTHCARLWFYVSDKLFIARFLNIHWSGVLKRWHGWCHMKHAGGIVATPIPIHSTTSLLLNKIGNTKTHTHTHTHILRLANKGGGGFDYKLMLSTGKRMGVSLTSLVCFEIVPLDPH